MASLYGEVSAFFFIVPINFREEEESFLIYNYTPYYVGKETINSGFQQVYVFPDP